MPLDPPALSTPRTDPAPSTPPPPARVYETVWRHTFLAQFTNPADREAIQRFGSLLAADDCKRDQNYGRSDRARG